MLIANFLPRTANREPGRLAKTWNRVPYKLAFSSRGLFSEVFARSALFWIGGRKSSHFSLVFHYISKPKMSLLLTLKDREVHPDGSITARYEIMVPFIRNRFSNPVGRLIGPFGQTAKWLRNMTNCVIGIDVERLHRQDREPFPVIVEATGTARQVQARIERAYCLIRDICDENEQTRLMSDYQLFHAGDSRPDDFNWHPSRFTTKMAAPLVLSESELISGSFRKIGAASSHVQPKSQDARQDPNFAPDLRLQTIEPSIRNVIARTVTFRTGPLTSLHGAGRGSVSHGSLPVASVPSFTPHLPPIFVADDRVLGMPGAVSQRFDPASGNLGFSGQYVRSALQNGF